MGSLMFWMNYEVDIVVYILHRLNFGFGEGQEAPTQIWEKREGEERGHMA